MKVYQIQLTVDEKWLKAIQDLTRDVYSDEFMRWESVNEEDSSQLSYDQYEMTNLDHERQVLLFDWCMCEGADEKPYDDCPREEK